MPTFTNFSKHAFMRLSERTQIDVADVSHLLDVGAFINTGCKPGFNKEHLVFYSLKDEVPFVAVRDRLSGTVVTVLPLDYHENLAWPISLSDQEKARKLAVTAPERKKIKELPSRFWLNIGYLDEDGRIKYKIVKKLSAELINHRFDRLLANIDKYDICEWATDKCLPLDKLQYLVVRLGRKGVPVVIDLAGSD